MIKLLTLIGTIIGGVISDGINVSILEITVNQAIIYFCNRFITNSNSEKIYQYVKKIIIIVMDLRLLKIYSIFMKIKKK